LAIFRVKKSNKYFWSFLPNKPVFLFGTIF
jgi:hypothetical protein